jgi:hypothetical protein
VSRNFKERSWPREKLQKEEKRQPKEKPQREKESRPG